jgi:hypothetical protein
MKLYHGTSAKNLDNILKHGIQPRGGKKGNWTHSVESRRDMVYLTAAYPLHFALSATKPGEDRLILEINIHKLNPWALHPDEDFLEQATRKYRPEGCPRDRKPATRWFREQLPSYARHWSVSIENIGNCCHLGPVPVGAITRYAVIPKDWPALLWSDPMIMLANYYVMGSYYRKLNAALFGDEAALTEEESFGHRQLPTREDLQGIEIFSVPHK